MAQYNLALLDSATSDAPWRACSSAKKPNCNPLRYHLPGLPALPRRHGAAIDPAAGLYPGSRLVEAGESLAALSKIAIENNFDFLRTCGADVLFENTL